VTIPEKPLSDPAEMLRVEAAGWFARMRRDDSERFRPEFEAWLADPRHRAAYNRIAARFADAKMLQAFAIPTAPAQSLPSSRRTATMALAAGFAALFFLLIVVMFRTGFGSLAADAPLSVARLEAVNGAVTRFRLRDGSVVTLDGNTRVAVRLDTNGRFLRLQGGRARFAVAHGDRPFTVIAANGKVVARGTIFDVSLKSGVADVALIEGAVDVTGDANAGKITKLTAGERVAIVSGRISGQPGFKPRAAPDWPRAMAEVRDLTLDALLARANRLSVVRIEVDGPGLGDTRLSGQFRLDDPFHLAANLARLLDLEQNQDGARIILARRTS
jgi:transmembrane sensor